MQRVKHHCKKCGFAEKLKVLDIISSAFLTFFATLGVFVFLLGIWYYIIAGNSIISSLDTALSGDFTRFAREHDDEIREVALNLTMNCSGAYSECYAQNIYYNLKDLKYVPPSKYRIIYDPIYTYENGGDCKNSASMVTALFHSLGLDAEVICSIEAAHCKTKVPLKKSYHKEYDKYIIIDLAKRVYEIRNSTESPWD